MNVSMPPLGNNILPANPNPVDLQQKSQEMSKDLVKMNVEAMVSLGKMEYIGTLVSMYV